MSQMMERTLAEQYARIQRLSEEHAVARCRADRLIHRDAEYHEAMNQADKLWDQLIDAEVELWVQENPDETAEAS